MGGGASNESAMNSDSKGEREAIAMAVKDGIDKAVDTVVAKDMNPELPPIRLIAFDEFCKLNSMPRYPENKDLCVDLKSIDRDSSLLVLISHCWLRGWSGAEGYNGRPHPDNANDDKFKLVVQGVGAMQPSLAPGVKKTYIWLDFGCMNQDADVFGEIKQLDKIVGAVDCIFTPVVGVAECESGVSNYYRDYCTPSWNDPSSGYCSRCWCRVEMFYAANIPLAHCTPERLELFGAGLKHHATNGIRPHIIYGHREIQNGLSPLILPPLQNSYYEQLHPLKGSISVQADLLVIEKLIAVLEPYMKTADCNGYTGELQNGKKHGKGVMKFPSGSVYEGEWRDDKKHGKGILKSANGNCYDGDWVDDKSHGYGHYYVSNGDVYIGQWVENNKHGQGTLTYADQTEYTGEWESNKKQGNGVLKYSNGNKFEGKFHMDMSVEGKFWLRQQGTDDSSPLELLATFSGGDSEENKTLRKGHYAYDVKLVYMDGSMYREGKMSNGEWCN